MPIWETYGKHLGNPIWETYGNAQIGIRWEQLWKNHVGNIYMPQEYHSSNMVLNRGNTMVHGILAAVRTMIIPWYMVIWPRYSTMVLYTMVILNEF